MTEVDRQSGDGRVAGGAAPSPIGQRTGGAVGRPGAGERLRVLRIIARMNVGGPARQVAVLSRHLDPAAVRTAPARGLGRSRVRPTTWSSRGATSHMSGWPGWAGRRAASTTSGHWPPLPTEVRRFRPHIVHTHTAKAGMLGRVASVLGGTAAGARPALVHTFHGHLLHGYFSPRMTTAVVSAERLLARRTDRLVAVGGKVRDDLVAAGIGRPDRWEVVPPGIELRAMPDRAHGAYRIGCAGRDGRSSPTSPGSPPSNAPIASSRSPPGWPHATPHVTFLVAGDGELAGELLERAAAAGLRRAAAAACSAGRLTSRRSTPRPTLCSSRPTTRACPSP